MQLCLALCCLKIGLAAQLLGFGKGNEHVVGLLVLTFGIDDLCLLMLIDGQWIELPCLLGFGKSLVECPQGVEAVGMIELLLIDEFGVFGMNSIFCRDILQSELHLLVGCCNVVADISGCFSRVTVNLIGELTDKGIDGLCVER